MTVINIAEIADRLKSEDIPAFVAASGGGTMTIYVGVARLDAQGDSRYPLAVGPGEYHPNKGSTADTADFYCGPDDDGVADPHAFTETDDINEVVDYIAATYPASVLSLAARASDTGQV